MGIPTAIPFDVVKVKEGGFGSVFELINSTPLNKLMANEAFFADARGSVVMREGSYDRVTRRNEEKLWQFLVADGILLL